jgi:hypothetical protein
LRWPRGRPLPPVRLGERASGPPNEGVERVDITRAFGEIVEELLTLRSVVEQFSFALAPGGRRDIHLDGLQSNMEQDERMNRVVPDIRELIGPPQNPEQIIGSLGRLFPTPRADRAKSRPAPLDLCLS